ncbi:hypothetical protein NDU88_001255 [Pleurodeles waltl]|uniref:Uncharacterized protein n=1 Tax=Pleurodeles waltl TaxID=8319 RepID=A0AAV7NA91_PLEWA|nr:hypothetical protein NDU88_001255 [Pleurodeles waltl]
MVGGQGSLQGLCGVLPRSVLGRAGQLSGAATGRLGGCRLAQLLAGATPISIGPGSRRLLLRQGPAEGDAL